MNTLYIQAVKKASELRTSIGLNMFDSLSIFDVCYELGITVRFVDVNMEGLYINPDNGKSPQILISKYRPLPRRVFTCAHELGHHLFNHGSKIDGLSTGSGNGSSYDNDEFLVDSFAGALLMPFAGIEAEFSKRKWKMSSATPIQFFTISSAFGVGYETLITHCKVNNLIQDFSAKTLLKQTPAKILVGLLGAGFSNSHFKIIDSFSRSASYDVEISNYIFLPKGFSFSNNCIRKLKELDLIDCYIADKPGIVSVTNTDNKKSHFIRIQNKDYAGLAEYRHLEQE